MLNWLATEPAVGEAANPQRLTARALATRKLVKIKGRGPRWHAELTEAGLHYVERGECPPGHFGSDPEPTPDTVSATQTRQPAAKSAAKPEVDLTVDSPADKRRRGGRPTGDIRYSPTESARDTEPEQFCTLVYAVAGVMDAGVELELRLGGHYPPLLRHGDGGIRPVGALGTALGLVPDPALVDTTVALPAGDLLCLFTDGLVEARSGESYFDGARVARVLEEARGLGAQGTLDRLAFAAHEFSAGPLSDDLAMLALSLAA